MAFGSASVTCCKLSPPKPPLSETLHLCPWCWAGWVSGARVGHKFQHIGQVGRTASPPCLRAAASAAQSLEGVLGWSPPSWTPLANGERLESRPPEEFEPGARRGGWQDEAASRTEQSFRDVELFARLDDTGQALLRSQGGPGAGLALTACPLCRVMSIEPQLFRVLLLRRLHPLPLTARHCLCGLPLDTRGHHRAACARVGVLGARVSVGNRGCSDLLGGWWASHH